MDPNVEPTDESPHSKSASAHIDEALDTSARELMLLANYYHEHGFERNAKEIYAALLKIRAERKKNAVKSRRAS